MIEVILGEKGTGKTKRLLQHANDAAVNATGSVVFVDDDNSYMFDLHSGIRFINAADYGIKTSKMLFGFLSGIASMDFDLQYIYVDGFLNFIHHELTELNDFFDALNRLSEERNMHIILSISTTADKLPACVTVL